MARRAAKASERQVSDAGGLALAFLAGSAVFITARVLGASAAAAGAGGFLTTLIAFGSFLWWTSPDRTAGREDLGRGLLVGGLIGVALGWGQIEVDRRQEDAQRERDRLARRAADRQDLQLNVGLRQDLRGIDLSGRDLSRFYLRGKDLSDARLAARTFAARTSPTRTFSVRRSSARTCAARS